MTTNSFHPVGWRRQVEKWTEGDGCWRYLWRCRWCDGLTARPVRHLAQEHPLQSFVATINRFSHRLAAATKVPMFVDRRRP